ncbi:MAG: alpha/beta fold hydrolase [Dehalococcoidia bacterium]
MASPRRARPLSFSTRAAAVLCVALVTLAWALGAVTPAAAAAARVPAPRSGAIPPAAAVPADPTRAGPYGVGVTTRTFSRLSWTTGEPRSLEIVIWYPAAGVSGGTVAPLLRAVPEATPSTAGPFPVLIFSHGAGSTPAQSAFLTSHLASHGYVVAAPPHPGATWDDCPGCGAVERQQRLLRDSTINRPGDVSFALDMMAALNADTGSTFRGALDVTRAAVIGHSWGGYTAVMAAATDRRFRAAVALAPVVNDTLEDAAALVQAPTLVMGGRLDHVTPFRQQERLFARLPAGVPHFLVGLPLGGHTAFSDVCPPDSPGCRPGELADDAHPLVGAYTVAFLNRYLRGDERYVPVFGPTLGGSDVEFVAWNTATAPATRWAIDPRGAVLLPRPVEDLAGLAPPPVRPGDGSEVSNRTAGRGPAPARFRVQRALVDSAGFDQPLPSHANR